MRRVPVVASVLAAVVMTGGCGPFGDDGVKPSGSTRYFFDQLEQADALADYITLPRSLADTLPNRTYVSRTSSHQHFTWTKQVVVGRVTAVFGSTDHRIRLRIRVEDSFPAARAKTIDVLVAGFANDEDRDLASAASLDRVVVGIDSFRDDHGKTQTVVAMASQLIGVVDERDRISYPVLGRQDFEAATWNRGMTTLAGLRREAEAPPSTIAFGVVDD